MRVKTFSTHVVVKKRHDVRKMAGFAHARLGITFGRPARAGMEDGVGIGSRKGRGPTQWGGPAESSVPARAHDMNSAPSPL